MPGDPTSPSPAPTGGVVLGVGASRGCPKEELAALADRTLAEAGAARGDVVAVATATIKADEVAVVALAADLGVPLRLRDAGPLAAVAVPTPSAVVAAHVGTPSVAEAAALLVAGGPTAARLLVPKRRSPHATCAVAAVAPTEVPAP